MSVFMNLKFKSISQEAIDSMTNVSANPFNSSGVTPSITACEELICDITSHSYSHIVNSGNSAIMIAMNAIDGPILIPNQGGWRGVKKIGLILNKKLIEIPTYKGIIEKDTFEEFLKNLNVVPKALFLTSFAGYTAEQSVKELFDICCDNNIILIEDVSGSISDPLKRLCNGNHNHIIVGSTGSPKLVNVGYGGFISFSDENILKKSSFLIKMLKCDPISSAGIIEELKLSRYNLSKLLDAVSFLKNKIKKPVIHRDFRGINVIVSSDNPKKDAYLLREKLVLDNGRSMITRCPTYDRLKEKAVCLEIKNLDTSCLIKKNLKEIRNIVDSID